VFRLASVTLAEEKVPVTVLALMKVKLSPVTPNDGKKVPDGLISNTPLRLAAPPTET
jgi:hypothetical protein